MRPYCPFSIRSGQQIPLFAYAKRLGYIEGMKKNPHAVALGRLGGRVTSDAKVRTARENGKRGGRPRLVTEAMDSFGVPLDEDELLLAEMANVPSRVHRFGVDVKLNLLQPGKRVHQHAERVKVFRGDQEFVVDLREEPAEIQHRSGEVFLSKSDFKKVIDGIKKYRIPFLIFWYSPKMDLDELEVLMKQVDEGKLTAIPDDIREKMHD